MAGLAVTAVAVAGVGATIYSRLPEELEAQPVFTEDGVAIRGTDPVAYFTEGKPVQGNSAISTEWNGATWHFSSEENRDQFLSDPEAYAPQYGGFCAWAVAEKGKLYSTQPDNWSIVDGKLYLNFNDDIQAQWEQDIPAFIDQGDQRWPEILASEG
ncbi:MAG: YHS domain-containing (seleno)protein [Geminicoccaceae bacterium]